MYEPIREKWHHFYNIANVFFTPETAPLPRLIDIECLPGEKQILLTYRNFAPPEKWLKDENDLISAGALVMSAGLWVQALVTRERSHLKRAFWSSLASVAAGKRLLEQAGKHYNKKNKRENVQIYDLEDSKLILEQEPRRVLTLPPVEYLVLRTFQSAQLGVTRYALQAELGDGSCWHIGLYDRVRKPRTMAYQLSKALKLVVQLQHVQLFHENGELWWELGPLLGEPGLN